MFLKIKLYQGKPYYIRAKKLTEKDIKFKLIIEMLLFLNVDPYILDKILSDSKNISVLKTEYSNYTWIRYKNSWGNLINIEIIKRTFLIASYRIFDEKKISVQKYLTSNNSIYREVAKKLIDLKYKG